MDLIDASYEEERNGWRWEEVSGMRDAYVLLSGFLVFPILEVIEQVAAKRWADLEIQMVN